MRSLESVAGALLAPILLGACIGLPEAPRAWRTEVALERGVKMGGCAAGDLLPGSPGDELAVTSGDGQVHVVRVDADGRFVAELVADRIPASWEAKLAALAAVEPGNGHEVATERVAPVLERTCPSTTNDSADASSGA